MSHSAALPACNTNTAEGFVKYLLIPFSVIIQQWQNTIYSSFYASEGISFIFLLLLMNHMALQQPATQTNICRSIAHRSFTSLKCSKGCYRNARVIYIPHHFVKTARILFLKTTYTTNYNIVTFELFLDFLYHYCSMSISKTFKCYIFNSWDQTLTLCGLKHLRGCLIKND